MFLFSTQKFLTKFEVNKTKKRMRFALVNLFKTKMQITNCQQEYFVYAAFVFFDNFILIFCMLRATAPKGMLLKIKIKFK